MFGNMQRFFLTYVILYNGYSHQKMIGESKFTCCFGFSIKCLQTSALWRVWCSFKRAIKFRFVWPIYFWSQQHVHLNTTPTECKTDWRSLYEKLKKKVEIFLKRHETRLVMSHYTFNIGKLFPYKDRQSVLHSVGVVFQLTCCFDQKYIGQMKRNLIMRLNEHRTPQSSEVCRHLMENPKQSVNFNSPIILDRRSHCTKLRQKETLHIAKRQPQRPRLMLKVNHCHYFYLMLNNFSFTGYLYC